MPTWLRSVVNAISGKVPGKTSRPDTATRMAMDADFSDRREPTPRVNSGGASQTMDPSSKEGCWRTSTSSRSQFAS